MSMESEFSERRLVGIGNFLRETRRELRAKDFGIPAARPNGRLTQEHVAELLDIAPVTYQKIEQGKYTSLNRALLARILTVLRVPVFQQQTVLINEVVHPAIESDNVAAVVEPHAIAMVQEIQDIPAVLLNVAHDILAWNAKAADLLLDFHLLPPEDRNFTIITYMIPAARQFMLSWQRDAANLVNDLRYSMARHPAYAARIQAVVDRVSAANPAFLEAWSSDFSFEAPEFTRDFLHPVHGELKTYGSYLELVASNGLVLALFTPRDDETRAKFRHLGQGLRGSEA